MELGLSFSIIIVCFNPGEGLKKAVDSVLSQTYDRYEIIIKDGGSTDGSVDAYVNSEDPRIKVVSCKDSGIYDAMNQAVKYASGDYVVFINAGDALYDKNVLSRVAAANLPKEATIAYGDTYFASYDAVSKSPAYITPSVCYRNIPCHQAIFYSRDTIASRGFDSKYRIRADYEHFLYSYFNARVRFINLGFTVCFYEGGGFSEKKANRALDKSEYEEIVGRYFTLGERFKYRSELILSMHKLRGVLARNKKTAKAYQKVKSAIIRLKKKGRKED